MQRSIGYFQRYSKTLLQRDGGHRRRFGVYSCTGLQYSLEQQEPVTAPFVPVRVIAGPGSGKTRVLVGRILHILQENANEAENILAVSFTNKTAGEMKQRVAERVSESLASKIFFGTFHSFCYQILKRYGSFGDWTVIDQDGCQRLMEVIVKEQLPSLDSKEVQSMSRSLLSHMRTIKNSVGHMDLEGLDEGVTGFFRAYQDALKEQQALDLDDLLCMCLAMLEQDDKVCSKLQTRFKHVLVDEFQDVNKVQYRILQMLCPNPDPHLFVVGDVDQAIYSWRGASVDIMQSDFQRDYSNSLTFRMKDNYRSRKPILDGAQSLINLVQNNDREVFNAVREGGNGKDITVHKYRDPVQEGLGIATDIKERLDEHPSKQLAILLRTHSQARCIESALIASKIPYRVVGGFSFWKRVEIMDIMAYLKLAVNPSDQLAFERVINTPKRGIGPSTLCKIKTFCADTLSATPSEVVLATDEKAFLCLQKEAKLSSKVRTSLEDFRMIMLDIRSRIVATTTLDEVIHHIISISSYREYVESNSDASRRQEQIDNIGQLLEQARTFNAALSHGDQVRISKDFIDHAAMKSAEDDSDLHPDISRPVIISTMHAAKGLEFDHVHIPGLNDGIIPLSPPKDKAVDLWAHMEEENRLLFVAVTRAKDSLVLSYTQELFQQDGPRRRPQLQKSRFLSCFESSIYVDFCDT